MSKDDAERVALENLLQSQLEPDERATVSSEVLHEKTQLMVYVDDKGKASLTWNVIIMTDAPLGQWMYFVNAGRPAIVHAFDSAEHVKQRKTYTANNTTSIPGRLLIDEGQRSNDNIAQAAHDNAGKVYDYYSNTFQRDAIDGAGSTMVSTVHYGSSAEDAQNAAWISQRQQMIYGDGGRIFQPLALGLDVVGHEFTHGVTGATASGALNESYSDVFAAMIDRANWTIGETVIKSPPFPVPYLRNMEDPSAGGRYDASNPLQSVGQPSNMSEYANLPFTRKSDNGGVHVNNGIPNHVAFLVAQAIGREKTEQIYYRTLTQILTPDADFKAAAQATMQAAQDLFGGTEVNAVSSAWQAVGLDVSGNAPQNNPTPPARTPSPTPSKAKQPTPVPQTTGGCTNVIVNGGFEASGGWVEETANTSIIDTELPHSGQRSAWLGGQDQETLQYIYQDVSIPANAASVKLNYWRLVHEEKKDTNQQVDDAKFWTVLANSDGDVLATVEQFVSSQGDDNWAQSSFDITQFAGKTVRVAFIASNPQNNISSYFVDDVELLSCTSGTPPETPPTSGNNVFVTGLVKSSVTGRGIEGALFIVLKEGLSASDAAADDNITDDEVLTFGTSDANGTYQTNDAIPAGKTYSVVVIAQGFRPILADDGLKIPSNATNPFKINATMRPN
ncbi:MAG: M4 family metallopeptidase [Chloroflexi bacterium]|nr:MAG: M4 family metallopeptidase [Chloroflexota bacterium]